MASEEKPAIKPGWQTTEFWLTTIKPIFAIIVLVFAISPVDAAKLETAYTNAVVAIFALIAVTYTITTYIKGRVATKTAASNGDSPPSSGGFVGRVLPLILAAVFLSLWALASPIQAQQPATKTADVKRQDVCGFFRNRGVSPEIKALLQQLVSTNQQIASQNQQMLQIMQQMAAAQLLKGQAPPSAATPIVKEYHYIYGPKLDLDVSGKPKIDLDVSGKPKIDLDVSGKPKINLDPSGKPKIDIDPSGKPKIDLDPNKGSPKIDLDPSIKPMPPADNSKPSIDYQKLHATPALWTPVYPQTPTITRAIGD